MAYHKIDWEMISDRFKRVKDCAMGYFQKTKYTVRRTELKVLLNTDNIG